MYYQTTVEERAAAIAAMAANREADRLAYTARPFRFEDLNGRPEPKSWGPVYTKPVKAKRPFNDETNIPTNCASGQKRCFDAAKHRAKIRAEFAAVANAEKRAWADGKSKNSQGLTIRQAYALAMKAKRARLEVVLELAEAA
jgi:hypothetical protein